MTTPEKHSDRWPFIGFRVSKAQAREIRAAAERRDESVGAFNRRAVLTAVTTDRESDLTNSQPVKESTTAP